MDLSTLRIIQFLYGNGFAGLRVSPWHRYGLTNMDIPTASPARCWRETDNGTEKVKTYCSLFSSIIWMAEYVT